MTAEVRCFSLNSSTSDSPIMQEIILHTLFESGITHIRDIERYITEDVVRYGNRLTDLEKKLVNAYREVVRLTVNLVGI